MEKRDLLVKKKGFNTEVNVANTFPHCIDPIAGEQCRYLSLFTVTMMQQNSRYRAAAAVVS